MAGRRAEDGLPGVSSRCGAGLAIQSLIELNLDPKGECIRMNDELFERGLEIRKSVLGAEYVEKSIANADDFTMPLQRLVTEYCWGACWGRDELPKKMRSLLNIAMLSCLGRNHELKIHTKGAIRNGCTKDEIREVLLQVAIYCGVPASVDSFRVAKEALSELESE
jgi:4-carboxymuconolactone decarboxylase